MDAAVRVIAREGLGAATATIAREAGVSNGSLFTYFATKTDLMNALYVGLKSEMAAAALEDLPGEADIRGQMFHMWSRWLHWVTRSPDKRRALAQLSVSGDITPASRESGHRIMADMAGLVQRSCETGPMRDAPPGLVVALMSAMADTTIDFMINDPANAETHCVAAFDALWRMVR